MRRSLTKIFVSIAILFSTCGCNGSTITPVFSPTVPAGHRAPVTPMPTTINPTETHLPVTKPTKEPSATPSPVSSPTLALADQTTPTGVPSIPAPMGMAYRLEDASASPCCSETEKPFFVVDASGQPDEVTTCASILLRPTKSNTDLRLKCRAGSIISLQTKSVSNFMSVNPENLWSPDSRYFFFTERVNKQFDIFVQDVWTEKTRNLTNTPERDEYSVKTWKANPNWVVFESSPVTADAGEGYFGYLSAIRTDGSQYTVISSNLYDGKPGISPIGPTIVYSDQAGQPAWMYRLGIGSQPFPIQNYGLEKFENLLSLSSWCWSPSGRYLTGWISGENNDMYENDIFLLDWEAGTSAFIEHIRPPFTGGGTPPLPDWSPDEKWISFYAGNEDLSRYALWIASRDGKEIHQIIQHDLDFDTCDKVWDPESKVLAFQCDSATHPDGIWIVEVDDWQIQKVNLPPGAKLMGWVH